MTSEAPYCEWCPKCGEPIIRVTRGIPSMGTCKNGHTQDRRDCLRRDPRADLHQQALDAARAEGYAQAVEDAARLCDPGPTSKGGLWAQRLKKLQANIRALAQKEGE